MKNQKQYKILEGLPDNKLTPEEEQVLGKQATDEAREQLVMRSMRDAFYYALSIVSDPSAYNLDETVIFSLCYSALDRAAKNFKIGFSTRFIRYAKPYIRGEIFKEWRDSTAVREFPVESAEDPIEEPGTSGTKWVESENFDFDGLHIRELWKEIQPIIKTLTIQEQVVLELRYSGDLDFSSIGRLMSKPVSREVVRKNHARALKKIRSALLQKKRLFNEGVYK